MSDQFNQSNNPIGYDPQTGQPIYQQPQQPQITGYDPQTGQPIYQQAAPQIVGYDPKTGQPIYQQAAAQPQPQIIGYDPKTGQPIYQQAAPQIVGYDPKTGQPIYSNGPAKGPKAPKKAGKKKGLIAGISAGVVVALAAIAIFVWPKPFSKGDGSSKGAVETAAENTGKAVFSHTEIGNFLSDTLSGNSKKNTGIDLRCTNIGSLVSAFGADSMYGAMLGSGQAGINVVVGGDGKEASFSMDASIMGQTYTVQMYVSEDQLIVAIPEILSSPYYIPLNNLEQELANSIFAPNKSQYSLDQYTYDELINFARQLSQIKNATGSMGNIVEDIETKLEQQGLKPQFTETNGSFTVGGETVNGTIATLDLGTEDLVRYVQFAKGYIQDYVGQLAQQIPDLSSSLDLSDFDSAIEELRNSNIAAHIELDIYKKYVVRMDIEIYDTTNRAENSAHIIGDFGKDPEKTQHVSISLSQGSNGEMYRIDYNILSDTATDFSSELTITEQGYSASAMTFNWNKSSGAFTLDIGSSGYSVANISGTAKVDGSKMTISPGTVSAGGGYYSYDLSSLQITIDSDASLTKPAGSAKDVLTLTEADIQNIMTEVQSKLGSIVGAFGGGY